MDEKQEERTEEPKDELAEQEQESREFDAAKLSDEQAVEAARAFLGTAEPVKEVSVDEAKQVLRRAGVAEAEPEAEIETAAETEEAAPEAAPAEVAAEVAAAPVRAEADTGRRWYVIHT